MALLLATGLPVDTYWKRQFYGRNGEDLFNFLQVLRGGVL
ncbi:hypothetical protein CLV76_1382 [Marivita geojedonensis]|nr:hypothetical protein CLV76_1382 [Marivita geojedonensis]